MVSKINETESKKTNSIKNGTDSEADSKPLGVNEAASSKIHDRINKKRDLNWKIGICFWEIIDFRDFTGNGYDGIVSEVIDSKSNTYQNDDDPSILFLMVLFRDCIIKWYWRLDFRQLVLGRRFENTAFVLGINVFLFCLHIHLI